MFHRIGQPPEQLTQEERAYREMCRRVDRSLEYIEAMAVYKGLKEYREFIEGDDSFGETEAYRRRFLEEITIKMRDAKDRTKDHRPPREGAPYKHIVESTYIIRDEPLVVMDPPPNPNGMPFIPGMRGGPKYITSKGYLTPTSRIPWTANPPPGTLTSQPSGDNLLAGMFQSNGLDNRANTLEIPPPRFIPDLSRSAQQGYTDAPHLNTPFTR